MFELTTLIAVAFWLCFCVCMVAISVYDIRYRVIRRSFLSVLVVLWLLYGGLIGCSEGVGAAGAFLMQGVIASVITTLGLCAVTIVYERVQQKESLGGGDIKLLAVLALYLGVEQTVVCLFVACVLVCVIAGLRWAVCRTRKGLFARKARVRLSAPTQQAYDASTFAFAPALCVSASVLLICIG